MDKSLVLPNIYAGIPLSDLQLLELTDIPTLKQTMTSLTAAYATAQSNFDHNETETNRVAFSDSAKSLKESNDQLSYAELLFYQPH